MIFKSIIYTLTYHKAMRMLIRNQRYPSKWCKNKTNKQIIQITISYFYFLSYVVVIHSFSILLSNQLNFKANGNTIQGRTSADKLKYQLMIVHVIWNIANER